MTGAADSLKKYEPALQVMQTVLSAVLLMLVGWVGKSVIDLQIGMAKLQGDITQIRSVGDVQREHANSRLSAIEDRNVNITDRIRQNQREIERAQDAIDWMGNSKPKK